MKPVALSNVSLSQSVAQVLGRPAEAYRSMFALGAVHALSGALVWILWEAHIIPNPIQIHPLMMSCGFLLSFAFGFLWTAVPRFTHSRMPKHAELLPLIVLSLLALSCEWMLSEGWTLSCYVAMMAWTLRFLIRRFLERGQNPPDSFVFVGIALVVGMISLTLWTISTMVSLPLTLTLFARSFSLKGIMLFLVLGVGFRLIPAILGINTPISMERIRNVASPNTAIRTRFARGEHLALAALLLAAFVAESLLLVRLSAATFAVAFSWSLIRGFHAYRVPLVANRFAMSVWTSVVCIVATPYLILAFPEQAVHLWHMLFIGGLGLMTIMISIRVSASHSGIVTPYQEEKRAYVVWMSANIVLAALTRMSVAWWPQTRNSHYVYAAALWILMLIVWFGIVFRYSLVAERRTWQQQRMQAEATTA